MSRLGRACPRHVAPGALCWREDWEGVVAAQSGQRPMVDSNEVAACGAGGCAPRAVERRVEGLLRSRVGVGVRAPLSGRCVPEWSQAWVEGRGRDVVGKTGWWFGVGRGGSLLPWSIQRWLAVRASARRIRSVAGVVAWWPAARRRPAKAVPVGSVVAAVGCRRCLRVVVERRLGLDDVLVRRPNLPLQLTVSWGYAPGARN